MSAFLKNPAGDHLLWGRIADSHTAVWHSCVKMRANLSTAVSACDTWGFKLPWAVALSDTCPGLPFDPPPQSMMQLSCRTTEKVEGRKENARRETGLQKIRVGRTVVLFLFPQQYSAPFKSFRMDTFYIFILLKITLVVKYFDSKRVSRAWF